MKVQIGNLFIFYILLLNSIIGFSQECNLITNVMGRKTISLNGVWQIIVDPYETGYYSYRYQPLQNGFFVNQKPASKIERVEYDFDTSDSLKVPGDWNSQRERLFFYEGTIWYKKDFDYTAKPDKRLFVYFGAANYEAVVYLNGQILGRHTGGFTPFNFEITDIVKERDNFLIVKVDNKRQPDGVPTLNMDWWNYGGLTRDVMLIETQVTYIRDYFIRLKQGTKDRIAVWIQLDGVQLNQKGRVRIPEIGVDKPFKTDNSGFAHFEFAANPVLWFPENPKLYQVEIITETDKIMDRIGFRTVEVQGMDILLNGIPIFLRGVCIHEQAPMRPGRANSLKDAEILLGWAKEMNANYVRLAHYPHNEHMVRLADEIGLLVWSEIPVYWTIQWDNENTLKNAQNQMAEMIARDKNRAAIILWSVANETPIGEARLIFLSRLIEQARMMDSSRLVTAALEVHYLDENTLMIDDPLGRYLDVVAINRYIGWYDGLPEKADRISWRTVYSKPFIISEFGAGAKQGLHGDSLTVWTEEYQASVYNHHVKMFARIPFLRGTSPWILMDFQSPRRLLPHIQDYWNRKGLISPDGKKKQAFEIMRRLYKDIQK
ncbi:MAG: glycoside hydrolase family 2 protein [Fidelibacterota bacterium]